MGPIGIVLAVLGVWLLVAVLLALLIGRAAHIGETKNRDEVLLRDLPRESARLALDLDQGVLQELGRIRSLSVERARVSPEAEAIAVAVERVPANARVRCAPSPVRLTRRIAAADRRSAGLVSGARGVARRQGRPCRAARSAGRARARPHG